ncbi:MAG TPA: serine/threonine-protein kinase [Gemmataceae bacterium]|nr:serine/threonine-protein kinase [Gemmataceae bacterium]
MPLDASKSTTQVVGDYELLEKIAEGGMGTVYRARHRQRGEVVAVKMVPAGMASNAVLLKRFENEFRAASSLDHPNIVRALDYGTVGGRSFLAMEFVEGESLGQRLERTGKLAEAEAVRIITLAAQGLHHAHKSGLIHRDVKPDNIMITPDGQVKLADLGLVKDVDTDLNLTRTGRGLGTPHFMAPEQFRNAKNADVRCDIYSLGATLYQMVTGELPFKSLGPLDAWMKKVNNELPPPRQLVPDLSERVDWAIRRAMHSDPTQRPASCREFIEDLTGQSSRTMRVPDGTVPATELWYLYYQDEAGVKHTVKGTTAAVRRSLREGLLGDASNVRAGRTKQGPFESLRSYPEFRDLVVPLTAPSPAAVTATPLQVPAPQTQTMTAPPTKGGTSTPLPNKPLINLDVPDHSRWDWLTIALVGFIAVAGGVIGYVLFFPK